MKKYLLKSIVAFIFLLIAGEAYAQKPNSYNNLTSTPSVGVPVTITPVNGRNGNVATSFAINTTPSNGLTFNTTTGVISGTPKAVAGRTVYTITPRNAAGTGTTFTVTITVGKGTITITASDVSKPYGTAITGSAVSTAFSVTGLAPTDNITSVAITYSGGAGAGASATANVGNYNNQVTPSAAVGTFNPANYNTPITYVKGDINVTPIPLTITATGPQKTYGTPLSIGQYYNNNTTTNFTYSGTINGQTVTNVFMYPDLFVGDNPNAAAGQAYTITPTDVALFVFPEPPQGANGFNANNYDITFVPYHGIVGKALVTVTANAVSKPLGTTLTSPVTGSTAFTSTGLQNGETIGSVTITYGAAAAAATPKGTYPLQVTPSAATGGSFSANNYTVAYTSNTLTVNSGIYDWTGANTADWATPQNWNIDGVQQTITYPGSVVANNIVQIGVVAYNSGRQPTLAANTPNPIASLTFGNATTPNTLTIGTTSGVSLTVSGNVTINSGTANLGGFAGSSFNIGGDYITNTGAIFVNNSATAINISGNFTNNGTTTFGTALVTFNSTAAVSLTTAAPLTLTNVAFTNNGKKSLTSGAFNLVNTGILTMGGNSTILDAGAGGSLTLLSDATGSASVAAIPTGCAINGQVNVQRYLSAHRGFRLLSSPVNSGATTSTGVYSINYVQNTVYLTSTTGAGGFDKASGPTLYIYKESFAGNNSAFTAGNFRDITDITGGLNTPPVYSIDLEPNPVSIPAGTAYLMYFRGDRSLNSLANETTAGFAATPATLTATGVLNQGPVTYQDLFNGNTTSLSYANAKPGLIGFNSIANPYACTIDLETLNAGGIAAPGVSNFIYEFNPVSQAFDVYEVASGGSVFTGQATRYIASGQGFFVQAKSTGQTVTINESAKVTGATTQNTGPNLFMATHAALASTLQYLRVQMAQDSINKIEAIINFKSAAKATYDVSEDAIFKGGAGGLVLSSMSADSRSLVINQLPLVQKGQVIRLNVSGTVGVPYTLNLKEITGIPQEYDVWLKDADKKDSVDLRVTPTYSFTMSTADTGSYGANRLSIVLRLNPAKAYKLISFDAGKTPAKDVELVWVTQNEQNYTHFTVERSTNNGKTYDVVGGMPSTGAGTYTLTDKHPADHNLYRLKQEDMNDSISYSNAVKIDFSNRGNDQDRNVSVYPNPARDRVTFAIQSNGQFYKAPTYKIEITNAWGFILQQTTSKQPEWQTNVGRFMPGTYYVRVVNEKDGSLVGQNKFVKL